MFSLPLFIILPTSEKYLFISLDYLFIFTTIFIRFIFTFLFFSLSFLIANNVPSIGRFKRIVQGYRKCRSISADSSPRSTPPRAYSMNLAETLRIM